MHLLEPVFQRSCPIVKSGPTWPRARLTNPDQVAQGFFGTALKNSRDDMWAASLYQGLAIFLEKYILLIFR